MTLVLKIKNIFKKKKKKQDRSRGKSMFKHPEAGKCIGFMRD